VRWCRPLQLGVVAACRLTSQVGLRVDELVRLDLADVRWDLGAPWGTCTSAIGVGEVPDPGGGAAGLDRGLGGRVPHDGHVPDHVRAEVGVPEQQVPGVSWPGYTRYPLLDPHRGAVRERDGPGGLRGRGRAEAARVVASTSSATATLRRGSQQPVSLLMPLVHARRLRARAGGHGVSVSFPRRRRHRDHRRMAVLGRILRRKHTVPRDTSSDEIDTWSTRSPSSPPSAAAPAPRSVVEGRTAGPLVRPSVTPSIHWTGMKEQPLRCLSGSAQIRSPDIGHGASMESSSAGTAVGGRRLRQAAAE
jgi:hypothetical protein